MKQAEALQRGAALVTVLMLVALLSALLVAYHMVTRVELSTTRSTIAASRGFYAAEAGLNLRAQEIRQKFLGYQRPHGNEPADAGGFMPCRTGARGSGDFRCESRYVADHEVATFISEAGGNPHLVRIPRGERYQNLIAQEYVYYIHSAASGEDDYPEAVLDMDFRSRLVPLFQFAAFYNKDLEIHPGPAMTLAGPVHSNGDLYLGSSGGLGISGQVTTAGDLYHGRKTDMACYGGGVAVPNPTVPAPFSSCGGSSTVRYDQVYLDGWNGMIEARVDRLEVPTPDALDPTPGKFNWDESDVRIVLTVDAGGATAIELRGADGTVDATGSATLNACGSAGNRAVDTSDSFYNNREGKSIRLLDVDVVRLLDCLDTHPALIDDLALDDTSAGGLGVFFTVEGPDSAGINGYGVRITNAGTLASGNVGAPDIAGMTITTDQAVYLWGDFNANDWVPAAIMADSINVLSNAWQDGDHALALSDPGRRASQTTVNAAFLGGTDVTGGVEGAGGQGGAYNGGLENFPRLHEKWSGVPLIYRGSFVSLNSPLHVNGPHTTPDVYSPPIRDWGYDVRFNDARNLPPMTPRFVYLKQDLFVRRYGH